LVAQPTSAVDFIDDVFARPLLDATPDGILLIDRHGSIAFANRQAGTLLAPDGEALVGRSVEDLVPDDLRGVHRAHRASYDAAPSVRAMGSGLLLRAKRTDGSEFPVEISLSPLRLDDEPFTVAALRDVTERVRAEDHLHRVLSTLDASDDAVFFFDAETLRYSYVNQGAVRLVGYSVEELLAMTPLDLNPSESDASYLALVASMLTDADRAVVRQAVLMAQDGTEIPVEKTFHVGPVGRDGSRWIVVLARDIRDRLAAEEELRRSQAALQRTEQVLVLAEDRERIARDLHDTVIQRLFGAGLQLQATMGSCDDRTRERLERVVGDLDDTIKELRTAIFGLQGAVAAPEGVRGRLFGTVTEAAAGLACEPRLELQGAIETLDERTVENLVAVVREALSNVARHADAASVRVSVTVDDDVTITVVDDGKGVPEQVVGGRGFENLRRRAADLGGTLDVRPGPQGGTALCWRVPVPRGGVRRGPRSP
jgi:PAS domain S-box-containing protein